MASRYATRTGTEFWRATWTIFGKQRSKCGFATQAEAEAFEAPLRGDDGMEGFSPDAVIARSKSTKLGAWLLIWWKQGYDRWTPETRRSYQRAINGVLAPYLQNVPLYSLTSPRVARFREQALDDGFTAHRVGEAMDVLSAALTAAKEGGYIQENGVKGVRRPKKSPPRPINPATPEDLERIRLAMLNRQPYGRFCALDALRNALAVSLAGYGGLRPSELVALRVRHINFDQGGLWVEDVLAGELREGDNKTHSPARFVGLWPPVMQDIATFIELAGLGPDDFILGDDDGEVSEWTHRNWRERHFNRAKSEAVAGLDDVVSTRRILALTPYDLRHSIVSVIAQAEGRDLREDQLAARMGHTIDTQRRTYRHIVTAQMGLPRTPVKRQIELAREKLGIDEAAAACIARIPPVHRPTAKLVDLGVERNRRRAA